MLMQLQYRATCWSSGAKSGTAPQQQLQSLTQEHVKQHYVPVSVYDDVRIATPTTGSTNEVRGMSLSKDIVLLIKEDHDRARSLYEQYKLPGTTAAQKRLLAWNLIREVSLHSAKEEEVVYPAMRDVMGDLTPDHLLSEHQQLKELLTMLNDDDVTNPNFDGKLQDLMEVLLHHMTEEEDDLLPRFAASEGVTSEYLMQLGRLFEATKLHAPSRPHPWAPNKPPLNIAANASVAPVDFLRDLVRFGGAPPL